MGSFMGYKIQIHDNQGQEIHADSVGACIAKAKDEAVIHLSNSPGAVFAQVRSRCGGIAARYSKLPCGTVKEVRQCA